MRITAGAHRGRRLRSPPEGVRPTQDMVREALFSILGSRIEGARFLDLYAGSGAVGLEALSRGAADVCWVEEKHAAVAVLRANAALLDVPPARISQGSVEGFLAGWHGGKPFDVIYADPPYASSEDAGDACLKALLGTVRGRKLLAADGVLVYESAGRKRRRPQPEPDVAGWILTRDRRYGRARLRCYVAET